ncbi:hypothetical protein [uncultured Tateyamaria sp.]|uniref:hypothetical protein n=1 Tax=uncultured Tateyamaria sp. TaxID=455651 RepID=UPI00260C6FCD|nr:hypothetical protein [uncultured Tateyamaria sp.]
MKKFENVILCFPMNKKDGLTKMQASLNEYGLQGWEVVSVVGSDFADIGMRAFLKRDIVPENVSSEAA